MIRKKEKITIIVDDREVPSGVLGVIEKMEDVTAVVKRMPLGDYVIDGRLLVERKTRLCLRQVLVLSVYGANPLLFN